MSMQRIPLDTGAEVVMHRWYRRGVWAVTPYVVHHVPSETLCKVTHIPSGYAVTRKPMSSDVAIQLCRLLGEFYGDFADDCPYRTYPEIPRLMRARVSRWVEKLTKDGSL